MQPYVATFPVSIFSNRTTINRINLRELPMYDIIMAGVCHMQIMCIVIMLLYIATGMI